MSTGTKNTVVSLKIQEWIDKFNTVKGWETLKKGVPKPEALSRRDPNEKFVTSPTPMLGRRMESLANPEERKLADEILKKNQSELKKLEYHLSGVTDPTQREKIQAEVDRRKQELSDLVADVELYDQLEEHLKKLTDLERDLPHDVKGVVQEIKSLQEQVDNSNFDVNTIDKERLEKFQTFHDNIAGRIDNARQEVMTMELETGSGTDKENYAVINSDQYKVLFGMLEIAILKLQLNEVDKAFEWVQQAADQLTEYRNVRTGAKAIEQKKSFDPQVDEHLINAQLMIDSLLHAGRVKAAAARKKTYDQLYKELCVASSTNETDIAGKFLGRAKALDEGATADMALSHRITELMIAAQRDVTVMRTNNHKVRPGKVEEKLKKFDTGVDLTVALKEMTDIREYAAQKLRECRVADLDRRDVDPQQMQLKLAELEQRFDKFFKHDGEGNVKTQKDSKTGLQKAVKKNSDLPRETIEELDLKIKAAQQLLASESIDALKLAQGQLEALEGYLQNIESSPKIYADFKEQLKAIETKINDLAKSHGKYEASKRADLQVELEKIRKDYMTKPQQAVTESIGELAKDVDTYKNLVIKLRGLKHGLDKKHAEATATLKTIGEHLAKAYKKAEPKLDGYHGDVDRELTEIRSKIDFRSEESLAEAAQLLTKLNGRLGMIEPALKKMAAKKSAGGDGYVLAMELVDDAKRGQVKHNEQMEQQKTFEKEVKALEKTLGDLKDEIEKVKGDLSNHGAIDSELDTIKKETKADRTYKDALEQVRSLAKRAEFQLSEVTTAREIVKKDLVEATTMVVGRVNEFIDAIGTYYKRAVEPEGVGKVKNLQGETVDGNELDVPPFNSGLIQDYFKSIADSIPKKALKDLTESARVVADGKLPREERLVARNTALASVRSLMSVFESFKPVQHFRLSPFEEQSAAPAFGAARQALPRLELRLLTAVEEKEKKKDKKKN